MPEQRTCDYTGEEIEPGTGIMYVRRDGTVLHFRDAKAEKNYFMGREAADLEWTSPEATTGADDTVPETVDSEADTTADTDAGDAAADADDTDAEAEPAEGEQE